MQKRFQMSRILKNKMMSMLLLAKGQAQGSPPNLQLVVSVFKERRLSPKQAKVGGSEGKEAEPRQKKAKANTNGKGMTNGKIVQIRKEKAKGHDKEKQGKNAEEMTLDMAASSEKRRQWLKSQSLQFVRTQHPRKRQRHYERNKDSKKAS